MAIEDINKEIAALRQKLNLASNAREAMEAEAELQAAYSLRLQQSLADQIEMEEDRLEKRKELNLITEEEYRIQKKLNDERRDGLSIGEEETKQARKRQKAAKNFADDLTADLAGLLGISRQWEKGIVGSFLKARKSGASFRDILKETGKSIVSLLNPLNIAVSLISKVVESTVAGVLALDQYNSSFLRATGATGEYVNAIQGAWLQTRSFGVRISEASEAITSLYVNMVDFTRLSPSMRQALAETVSLMAEAGVSTQTSSQALDVFTKVMRLSASDATVATRELFQVARNIGMSVETVMSDFAQASSRLAMFGDNMLNVFEDLEAQAKATGISVQGLMGIVGQFDTFEGAANAASRLNSILGGPYINSMEMLMATDDERIDTLRSLENVLGTSWQAMSRQTRQAVASALGISNMSDAARLFGSDAAAFEEAAIGIGEARNELEALNQIALQTQSVTDVLASLMDSFAAAIPQEMMNSFKDTVSSFTQTVSDFIGGGGMESLIARVQGLSSEILNLGRTLLYSYAIIQGISVGAKLGAFGGGAGTAIGALIGAGVAAGGTAAILSAFESTTETARLQTSGANLSRARSVLEPNTLRTTNGRPEMGQRTITLNVNNREFASAVVDIINDATELRMGRR